MIKAMKRSLVLAVAVAALSAIAVPSMASAASWTPVGTSHAVTSNSISFITSPAPALAFSCNSGPTLGVNVASVAALNITSASNFSCTGLYTLSGCNVAASPAGLPWTTGPANPTNVTINSLNINLTFSPKPGFTCIYSGLVFNLYGTLAGGVWSNPGFSSSLVFTNATGLKLRNSSMPPGSGNPVTLSGTLTDSVSPFITQL